MSESPKLHNSNKTIVFLVIISNSLVLFSIFYFFVLHRNIDGDEGLYLEASRLVAQGKTLYLDFFYQQMPLIPYLYAAWMKFFGFSLLSSRYLSVILTTLSGIALLIYIARRFPNPIFISFYALLFYGSGIVLAWAPVFKTHPLNIFTLTLSSILLAEWRFTGRRFLWMILASGLLIGVGINSRLLLLPFLGIFSFFLFFQNPHRWKDLFLFYLIVGLTSIPTFYFLVSNPQQFIQYNLVYHMEIYPGIVDSQRRINVASDVFLRSQMILLLLAAQAGLFIQSRSGWKKFLESDTALFGSILILFIIIHMSSAEPYTQYFSAMIPLALLTSLPLAQWLQKLPRAVCISVLGLFFFIFLRGTASTLHFEIASMGSTDNYWELKKFKKSVATARQLIPPGQTCLTWWPGYAFETGCQSAAGMENHMRNHAIQVGIPGSTLEQYKMMSEERLMEDISNQKYPYIIEGAYRIRGPYADSIDELISAHYSVLAQSNGVHILIANSLLNHPVKSDVIHPVRGKVKGKRSPSA